MTSTETSAEGRKFALHDRFSLMRRNAGYPQPLSALITYPSSALLPSSGSLATRIAELEDRCPLLWTTIEGRRTPTPRHVPRKKKWSAEEILSEGTYVSLNAQENAKKEKAKEVERVLQEEMRRFSAHDDEAPMWAVRLVTPTSSFSSSTTSTTTTAPTRTHEQSRAYLIVSIDHIIGDGGALLLLVRALLAEDISYLPYEKLEDIPPLEDTVNLNPSIGYIIPLIFRSLILPHLPSFVGAYFQEKPVWPQGVYRSSSLGRDRESDMMYLHLPSELVTSLKTVGKDRGVSTLHPILKAAYMTAIWKEFQHTLRPFILRAGSPLSQRDPALGHSALMANYINFLEKDYAASPNDEFWALARRIKHDLTDPAEQQRAKYAFGSLKYVPDGLVDPPHADPHRPTKWEDFFLDKLEKTPYSGSLGISNLGLTSLPKGAEDLAWAQMGTPFGQTFSLDVVGHEMGLAVTTHWMEGGAVVREEVERVQETFKRVLERLAGNTATTTLDQLTKA